MLEIKSLGYWYQTPDESLFSDVNLKFEAGKTYAIIGASGAGKTTFLSLLAGLDQPKTGEILLDGQALTKIGLTAYRRHQVTTVFQSYNLLPYMSPINNLLTALAITESQHKGDTAYAKQQLHQLGLTEDQMKQNVQHLSGGQQQRVAIARSMCCDAQLVVADEPTGNLDEANTAAIIELFQKIAHEQHKCVIIVTHETDVAAACDQTLKLSKGEFEWVSQPA